MADPTFRAASAIVLVPSNGNGSVNVDLPTGTVDGDYIFIVCVTGAAVPQNVSPSGGFGSPLLAVATSGYNIGVRIFGKVASSEPSTYTVTEAAAAAQGHAFAISYSNPGGTPINASLMSSQRNGTTTPTIPTLTTTETGKLLAFCWEYNARNLTISPAGSLTQRVSQATGNRSFLWSDEDIATTGSISGRSVSSSGSGDFYSAAILLTAGGGSASLPPPKSQFALLGVG